MRDYITQVGDARKYIQNMYDLNKYQKCLDSIKNKKVDFTSIAYDPKSNQDKLHRMKISHDTLIDYSLQIVEQHDLLKKIIIHKYPYICIDEYQDTNEKVIRIIRLLKKYAELENYQLFVGFFGDHAQHIYGQAAIGRKIIDDLNNFNLKKIDKNFNRRSYQSIIDVINNIRGNDLQQVSISHDNPTGTVEFYHFNGNIEQSDSDFKVQIIRKFNSENTINDDKLHCLVLTNKLISNLEGFGAVSDFFTDNNQLVNFNSYSTKFLSHDTTSLDQLALSLYRIIELYKIITSEKFQLSDLICTSMLGDENISLDDIAVFQQAIRAFSVGFEKAQTVSDLYDCINKEKYNYDKLFCRAIDRNIRLRSEKGVKNYLADKLYTDYGDDASINKLNNKFDIFLELPSKEIINYYNFISKKKSNDRNSKVQYHTYHGTKGLEFDHVTLVMENDFGPMHQGGKNKFPRYFEADSDAVDNDDNLTNTKNLLYVACSRAKKSLKIIYLDPIVEGKAKERIEYIFGKIQKFQINAK